MKVVRQKLSEALEPLQGFNGLTFEVGGGSYGSANATFKVNMALTIDGEIATPDAEAYRRHQDLLGLPPLGTEFMFNGEIFETSGYRPKSRKYPILAKNAEGKTYKFGVATIKALTANAGVTA